MSERASVCGGGGRTGSTETVFVARAARLLGFEAVTITALDSISLQVSEGEIFGLLGANGSGKSTLIRILSTILLPDEGSVSVLGHDVVRDSMRVREVVTRVSVDPALYRGLSARENLAFSARIYDLNPKEVIERCLVILKGFDFKEKWLDVPVAQLSRGNQQKVAISRAFISSPVVLCLDEPTTGLDPASRKEVNEFIKGARDSYGATILLATHDMRQAAELCDRIAIVRAGQLIAEGDLNRLLRTARQVDADVSDLEEAYLALTGHQLGD